LFVHRLFRAGRGHNELWKAAITHNKGRNNISFGTCRRETLKILRTMVDDIRPRFQYYDTAKRTNTTKKKNEKETLTPPTKKRKTASPNKCRVSDEKLDFLKRGNNWRRLPSLVENEIQDLSDESVNNEEERMTTI
jgi:hypothetical protein